MAARLRASAIATLIAALLATGCTSATTTETEPDPGAASETVPLALTRDQRAQREQVAVAACMKDAGFEYLPEYFADTPSLLLEIGDRFTADPYTGAELTPDTYASEHGLGIVAHYEANRDGTAIHVMPSERANQRYWRTLTTDQRTEFNEALHGGRPPDTSSCLAQAEAGLWAFTITDLGSGPTAVDQTMDIVSAIPEVAAALDSWQECMGDRGIDVVDPDDAFESFASRVQPEADTSPGALDQLRADEVTFAIAHRACDASSGLSDAFAAEFEREWNVAFGNP